MASLVLTVIGGGSSYTPELAEGIINNHSTFPVGEIRLVDVQEGLEKVEVIEALLKRMMKRANLNIQVSSTLDRRQALRGADYVISQFRQGGLEARSRDEKIPLRYRLIGQETTGAGGFANALRTIPETLAICRDMQELCPDAWLINFTNPSGIVTEAVHTYTDIRCIGLCNVPINMARGVARGLGLKPAEVSCRFAGLNHLSFIGGLYAGGRELLRGPGKAKLLQGSVVKNISGPEIPADLMEMLEFIPSPYLRYFYLEQEMLAQELEELEQKGQTRADEVRVIEKTLFEKYKDVHLDVKPEELSKRGGALYSEAAVSLMGSIYNDRSDIQVVNVVNNGCLPELPGHAVIETNCVINRQGATPLSYGAMPQSVRGLVQQVKAYEQLTVRAAVTGSRAAAFQALLNNPLVHGANNARKLLDDILRENSGYLAAFSGGEE